MKPIQTLAAIAVALLATACASPAHAKSHLSDILNKGSRWALNVDGQEGTMTLLGGNGHRTPDGGWTMEMEVEWRGHRGILSASADAENRNQSVVLNINQAGVTCNGFVAQYTGILMAGTSRRPAVGGFIRGAWCAVKLPQSPAEPQAPPAPVDPSPTPPFQPRPPRPFPRPIGR